MVRAKFFHDLLKVKVKVKCVALPFFTFTLFLSVFRQKCHVSKQLMRLVFFFADCHLIKDIKKRLERLVLERFRGHITGICSTFLHKNGENRTVYGLP